jgi:protein required for attachment to host cells
MKSNWVVVANASRARVLEEADAQGTFTHVADLTHPQSRSRGRHLASDRPGHVEGIGHGLGNAAYRPRTDPHDREHDRFAREVATTLNDGIARGSCVGLVLVASDPFLGLLKSHLSTQARKALLRTVASDYTALRDNELAPRLRASAA